MAAIAACSAAAPAAVLSAQSRPIVPAALSEQQARCEDDCGGEPDRDRNLDPRIGSQPEQPNKRECGECDLGEKFEGDVDDRARCRGAAGDAGEHDRPGTEQVAADLRNRQYLGAGIADETPPDRDP